MAVRKLDPLVIGKSKNPRCFKNVNKLPVSYQSNKNAWMTAEIWREWMKRIDSRMCSKKRSIVMLCDNWAAHSNDTKLINVKLVFLPPNTTSLIQPIDMGIIANFKKLYRSLVLRRLVNNIDGGTESTSDKKAADMARKLTVLDSLHIQREAWSKITQLTTVNCYRKASFAMAEEKNEENEDEQADSDSNTEVYVPPGMSDEDFNCYMTVDNDLSTEADVDLSSLARHSQLIRNTATAVTTMKTTATRTTREQLFRLLPLQSHCPSYVVTWSKRDARLMNRYMNCKILSLS